MFWFHIVFYLSFIVRPWPAPRPRQPLPHRWGVWPCPSTTALHAPPALHRRGATADALTTGWCLCPGVTVLTGQRRAERGKPCPAQPLPTGPPSRQAVGLLPSSPLSQPLFCSECVVLQLRSFSFCHDSWSVFMFFLSFCRDTRSWECLPHQSRACCRG